METFLPKYFRNGVQTWDKADKVTDSMWLGASWAIHVQTNKAKTTIHSTQYMASMS